MARGNNLKSDAEIAALEAALARIRQEKQGAPQEPLPIPEQSRRPRIPKKIGYHRSRRK